MNEKLYLFRWDCGRMGFLDGLFIAYEAEVERLIGKEIYFGEVLGKHSEIYGVLEKEHITAISEDQATIATLKKHGRHGTICGHNPLDCEDEE